MKKKDALTRMAHKEGYRARSAYKLKQINKKFSLIHEGNDVLDLGCFPGGWLIASKEASITGRVVGLDLEQIEPIEGVEFFRCDVKDAGKVAKGKFDVVLSDMAPNTTGNRNLDVSRSFDLAMLALKTARKKLNKNGNFVCKIFQGKETEEFMDEVKKHFKNVRFFKPEASKKRSMEMYVVAQGFKG
jgi:23S rRNA (uridine2552-2'-O)-methyltransferase